MAEPTTYPALLGIACDGVDPGTGGYDEDECLAHIEADFLVADTDTRDTRLGYVLDHAARNGWTVAGRHMPATALTYCPAHADQAPTRRAAAATS